MKIKMLIILGLSLLLIEKNSTAQNYQKDFLSKLEKEVADEINLARANPKLYIEYLKAFRSWYRGKQINLFNSITFTVEGVAALDDAIEYLKGLTPTHPLEYSEGMSMGAKVHGVEQSKLDTTGHQGKDGNYCDSRVGRFGQWEVKVAENLCYGWDKARYIVMNMIIDDGVFNRSHRRNIFLDIYNVIGVYCDSHATYRILCVITFAGDFKEH